MLHATTTVLDLTNLAAEDLSIAVVQHFEQLKPGEEVVLQIGTDPRAALQRLQATAPHAFDWWPLQAGPETWRIHLAKVDGDPDEPRTILEVLEADHLRLDHLYGLLSHAFDENDLSESRRHLGELRVGLDRHCRAEEQLLLPLLEEHGGPHGAKDAEAIRVDHQRMIGDFGAAWNALAAGGEDAIANARDALTDLEGVMRGHHRNEERVFYPVCDEATKKGGRRAEVIRQIQAM